MSIEKLVGDFNQEKALVGAFSLIMKTDGSFAALILVPLESLLLLLGKEILTPFYVFQVFSLTWWTIDKETTSRTFSRNISKITKDIPLGNTYLQRNS